MENSTTKPESWFHTILEPKAFIFGLTLAMFIWTWIHESQIDWSLLNYHGAYENTHTAFWLLIASLALLLGESWGYLIAMATAGRVFYLTGYLPLWIYVNVSETGSSILNLVTLKNWLHFTLSTQPQYILHAIIGVLIFSYSTVLLSCQIIRQLRLKCTKPNNSFNRSAS